MGRDYTPEQRALQDRFDSRRLADRLTEGNSEQIGEAHRSFIEARDMFFIASVDSDGFPQCSYKGGSPGFVRVIDPTTIAFPLYDGNGMFLTAGNVEASHRVGLLFIDFEGGSRLRLNGEAGIDLDDPLLAEHPEALVIVRVGVTSVFANCRRYVHNYELGEPSVFAPDGDHTPPVPDWKLDPWFDGTLPEKDRALDPSSPSAPATPYYS